MYSTVSLLQQSQWDTAPSPDRYITDSKPHLKLFPDWGIISLLQMKSGAELLLTCTAAPRQLMVQGVGLKSCLCCLSAKVKGKISFCLTESVSRHSDEESLVDLLCGEGNDKEICQESQSCPSIALRPHASCYTMKGALSFSSLPPSPLWNLHKKSWPFWLPSPSKPTRYWWGYFAVFGCI